MCHSSVTYSLTHVPILSDYSDHATPSASSSLTHYHCHVHTLTYREWGDRDRGGYSRNNNSNNNSSAGVNPVRDALVVSALTFTPYLSFLILPMLPYFPLKSSCLPAYAALYLQTPPSPPLFTALMAQL